MEYALRTKTVQALNKAMTGQKITIRLDHDLQREEGQWNKKAKSDLIDSLLRQYPINPIYAIKTDENDFSVIDGIQRLSTLRDYIANKFALSKDIEDLVIDGETVNISGLKFKKLPENVQDALLSSELQVYELTNWTPKDVREMFRRQNAGKPLNSRQMRVVYESEVFSKVVYELSNHPFMIKIITNAQRKSGVDRDIIRKTFMLMSSNQEKEFTSFSKDDMDKYVAEYADSNLEKAEILKTAMDKFNEAFENLKLPSSTTTIPEILYLGYKIVKDKKSFSNLVEVINSFVTNYENNEDYKKFVQARTTDTENVTGRLEWWKNKLKEI